MYRLDRRESGVTMIQITFSFDKTKAIEAILYLASKLSDPTFHSINKLFYFADKISLERYGRFIAGDTYYAMQYGPVPTSTYDMMKNSAVYGVTDFRVHDGQKIVPSRAPNMDEFSDSDVEVLNMAIEAYSKLSFKQRTELSHDSAYDEAWDNRGMRASIPMSVESIAKTLSDGEGIIEFLHTQHE